MAKTVTAGKTVPLSIGFLDQFGAEFVPTPTPDSPPTWTQANPAAGALSFSADGLTGHYAAANAAGADTVTMTVMVGGVIFSATLDISVVGAAPAPILTSVVIIAGDES